MSNSMTCPRKIIKKYEKFILVWGFIGQRLIIWNLALSMKIGFLGFVRVVHFILIFNVNVYVLRFY